MGQLILLGFENQTFFKKSYIGLLYILLGKYNIKALKLRGEDKMGLFNKVMTKEEGVNIEDFLNNLDEVEEETYDDADAFVKPMDLIVDSDVVAIINEAKQGNIVLMNISDLAKRNAMKLKELVGAIKVEVKAIDGDIARISQGRVLVTPSKVKIIKKKGQ